MSLRFSIEPISAYPFFNVLFLPQGVFQNRNGNLQLLHGDPERQSCLVNRITCQFETHPINLTEFFKNLLCTCLFHHQYSILPGSQVSVACIIIFL